MTPDQPDPDQPPTFAPPRSGRWLELLMQYRYAVVIALVLLFVFGQKAMAQEHKSGNVNSSAGHTSANGKLLPGPRIGLNMNGGSFYNTTCSRKA